MAFVSTFYSKTAGVMAKLYLSSSFKLPLLYSMANLQMARTLAAASSPKKATKEAAAASSSKKAIKEATAASSPKKATKEAAAASSPKKEEAAYNRALRAIEKSRKVSPEMQAVVGVPRIPPIYAFQLILNYIWENKLQDPDNKRIVVCDEKLKKIFGGKDRVDSIEISSLIDPHFLK